MTVQMYSEVLPGCQLEIQFKSREMEEEAEHGKAAHDRYKLTGKFFKENSYLNNYGTNKSGGGLAKYILKRAIKDKNIKVLLRFLPDMGARFIGMKVGMMSK